MIVEGSTLGDFKVVLKKRFVKKKIVYHKLFLFVFDKFVEGAGA